jgi:hypothetical protein
MQTPFFAALNVLKGCIPSGGSCPSWIFNANLGFANFGSHEISPPCWIWPAIAAIIIFTSIMTARKIIFGG